MQRNLKDKFIQYFGDGEVRFFFSPGRVNLIGEHIDYNGGFVFPAALTLGITAVVRANTTNTIRLVSLDHATSVTIDLDKPVTALKDDWGNYPKGVVHYLLKEGYSLSGCDILFHSNLPEGAGLSSSASLEVLMTYIMLTLADVADIDRIWIATFSQMVENKFIHVHCGIMDQFAVSMGRENAAILLNCSDLQYKYIPLELNEYSLLIMNTNKKRELTDSKYNERRAECEEALSIIRQKYPVNNLCEISDEAILEIIQDETLKKRASHVVSENKRVLKSVEVLQRNDLNAFALLLIESHLSLKCDYEVTGFELDTIVAKALKAEGCIGARMTGAGFGGCAIALVKTDAIDTFKKQVRTAYYEATKIEPSFYISSIGNGVNELTAKEIVQ